MQFKSEHSPLWTDKYMPLSSESLQIDASTVSVAGDVYLYHKPGAPTFTELHPLIRRIVSISNVAPKVFP